MALDLISVGTFGTWDYKGETYLELMSTFGMMPSVEVVVVASSSSIVSKPHRRFPRIKNEYGFTSCRGLTGIYSSQNDRYSLMSSLKNRRCFATTGARIYLKVVGHAGVNVESGSVLTGLTQVNGVPTYPITLSITAIPDKMPISEVFVIKIKVDGGITEFSSIVNASAFSGNLESVLTFSDTGISDAQDSEFCYYVRVEQSDGHCAWSSPIWFNYGREPGIRASIVGSQTVSEIVFSTVDGFNYNGLFSSAKNQSVPLSEFNLDNLMPELHQRLFAINDALNITTRQSYKNASLYVSDRVSDICGSRVYSDLEHTIVYGTGYLRFLYNAEEKQYYKNAYEQSGGVDKSGPNKYAGLKYLGDLSPYNTSISGDIAMRNKLFGYMWQYDNDSETVQNPYSISYLVDDTVNIVPIVRDPYLTKYNENWYIFYSSFVGSYPEKSLSDRTYDASADLTVPETLSTVLENGRIEDFAGLLENSQWDSVTTRIASMVSTDRKFDTSVSYLEKNYFVSGGKNFAISYPSSPNVVQMSDGSYRLYYLGWYRGGDASVPTMALFCQSMATLDDLSGTPTICFVFCENVLQYPNGYYKKTTIKTDDVIWSSFNSSGLESTVQSVEGWPSVHPAYSLGFAWCSIVRRFDNMYYCFFNKNTSRNIFGEIVSGMSTGVLYSIDGINFKEYNAQNVKIDDIKNKLWFSTFLNCGKWYGCYRENGNSLWSSKNPKIKYSAFNWKAIENFRI